MFEVVDLLVCTFALTVALQIDRHLFRVRNARQRSVDIELEQRWLLRQRICHNASVTRVRWHVAWNDQRAHGWRHHCRRLNLSIVNMFVLNDSIELSTVTSPTSTVVLSPIVICSTHEHNSAPSNCAETSCIDLSIESLCSSHPDHSACHSRVVSPVSDTYLQERFNYHNESLPTHSTLTSAQLEMQSRLARFKCVDLISSQSAHCLLRKL